MGLRVEPDSTYDYAMTKSHDQAPAITRSLRSDAPVALSADDRSAIAASKAAAARGEFATDAEVRVTWAKHGL